MSNHHLGKELHKTDTRKLDKGKIRQSFKDNIQGADRLHMQLYAVICVIDIYNKYECVIPLKDKKDIAITNLFQKVLHESNHNSNKLWVDRGSEYYNRSMKSWLKDNDIEIYEHIMLLLKDYYNLKENFSSVSKNVNIDKLDGIVSKYNNTYHSTIKMKPFNVKSSIYFDIGKTT